MIWQVPVSLVAFLSRGGSALGKVANEYARVMVLCILLRRDKLSLAEMGRRCASHQRHRSNVGKVLDSRLMDVEELQWLLLEQWTGPRPARERRLSEEEQMAGRIWLLIIDSTYRSRSAVQAENTIGQRRRRKRKDNKKARSKRSQKRRRCHGMVKAVLITDCGARLPVPGKAYYTKGHCRRFGKRHYSQVDLAAQMIQKVVVPADVVLVVVYDSFFEGSKTAQACEQRGFLWIAPCDGQRCLAEPGKEKYSNGKRVQKLWCGMSQRVFTKITLTPETERFGAMHRRSFGQEQGQKSERHYWVNKRSLVVAKLGPVTAVFSKKEKAAKKRGARSRSRPTYTYKTLLTNAHPFSAAQIVELYELRWQIELYFREIKSHLGFCDLAVEKFQRYERFVGLVDIAFLYLEKRRQDLLQTEPEQARVWGLHRARTRQMKRWVEVEVEKEQWAWMARTLQTEESRAQWVARLEELLMAA